MASTDKRTITKKFTVKVTPDEEREFGKKAANLSYDLVILSSEFSELKKEWTGKLQKISNEVHSLHRCLRTGEVTKELEAMVEYDPKIRMVSYTIINPATKVKETLETRPMTDSEMQLSIPVPPVKAPDVAAAPENKK
jgi:hypothetical protein